MKHVNPNQFVFDFEALKPKERSIDIPSKTQPIPIGKSAGQFLADRGLGAESVLIGLSHARFNPRPSPGKYSILRDAHRKTRVIDVPNPPLRALHKWLLHDVLLGYEKSVSTIACGIAGRQLVDMVEPHLGARYFFKFDIERAYQSVDITRLGQILSAISGTPPEQWEAILTRFCQGSEGGLATGGIVSPLLFNLYMSPLDEQFCQIASDYQLTVSRYMDDLVFSSTDEPIGKRKAARIKQSVREYGMALNPRKVRYHDLKTDRPFLITGLQINPSGKWQMQATYLKRIIKFYKEVEVELETHGDTDMETMGVVRGLNGHLMACRKQQRPANDKEIQAFKLYHSLEKRYRILHPDLQ